MVVLGVVAVLALAVSAWSLSRESALEAEKASAAEFETDVWLRLEPGEQAVYELASYGRTNLRLADIEVRSPRGERVPVYSTSGKSWPERGLDFRSVAAFDVPASGRYHVSLRVPVESAVVGPSGEYLDGLLAWGTAAALTALASGAALTRMYMQLVSRRHAWTLSNPQGPRRPA